MRKFFSKQNIDFPLPNPTRVQLDSFNWLVNKGLNETLYEVGKIYDNTGRDWVLEFSSPRIEKPNRTVLEAKKMGLSYDAPWYVTATITKTGTKQEKKKEIYMGDIPLMTNDGIFIVNGVSKVVINQLARAQGVFFGGDLDPSGKFLPSAKILPKTGAWIDFETSKSAVISVRIDRKRKIPATVLLRLFGLETDEEIINAFKDDIKSTSDSPIFKTLERDSSTNFNEAAIEVYKKMRPGEPIVIDGAVALVDNMFFNLKRYSLGNVGRFKLNMKLGLDIPEEEKYFLLQQKDIVEIIKYMIHLYQKEDGFELDDIDSLANRRVRSVGELLQSEIRYGFYQLERLAREKMALQPRDKLPDPSLLISPRPVSARIISYLSSGQLSQMLGQYNPLDSLDHKRRLSVMGKGGLTRERASYAVRDAHPTHYGKIDAIRSPEGLNIGLVTYLALYAKVNEYGFIETPYAKLKKEKDGKVKVSEEIEYLAAYQESKANILGGDVLIDEEGYIIEERVPTRRGVHFFNGFRSDADYIEIAPHQILGVSTALIPFIANDDVARALITAQQSSQAVPLVRSEEPIVGTGIEGYIADSADLTIRAEYDGVIEYSDASKIIFNTDKGKVEYKLLNFTQSNNDSCYSQSTVVKTGTKIKKGDLLAEGPSCKNGELALGVNLRVAFMSYEGFNYEDAFIISDRAVKEDLLSSINISDYTVQVMETKLGPEELTNDIPNVSEESLRNLGSDGIVVVGSHVKSGDILVGKIAPKGQAELSAEERLLRAVFGERAKEVKDNSLRLPHGRSGVVIDVQILTPRDKEQMAKGVIQEVTVKVAEYRKISVGDKLSARHGQKGVIAKIAPVEDMPHFEDGTPVDVIISPASILGRMNIGNILETHLGWAGWKTNTKYAIPAFRKIQRSIISDELKNAGLPVTGKTKLIDGRTGEYFDQDVTVGTVYIYKLHHMAEEKIHARSTGPYSLITQQPLGGKAQFGGQRFGEMEVWALEAFGASETLNEMLTIKSDDIRGRYMAFQSIIKGLPIPESHIPESFKLLVRQLNSLGLGIIPLVADGREKVAGDEFDEALKAVTLETEAEAAERDIKLDELELTDEIVDDIIEPSDDNKPEDSLDIGPEEEEAEEPDLFSDEHPLDKDS
jgi:DNA-directed RNA polymerase subunit beta